ncbi:ROK family protein [Beutenbergia cavernae DSM 12333]|uniref:ROK family protein n=1 Tax=Beutenbergia cavernae (strain ATCC BAA-8 / DSM 12333 / CCUG 43141 / JCM 11478 / NBRC 16432 / NCIMB 13614 / HKI 0122) TaxID=471853 RepID=C5C4B6_BEUC1|nr:ROK family transcriptional regulator [Beutenbergia cavernae]ACQ82040.1 ROK family protein [Beutenbergia cavernae DSM 12333]
MAISAHIDSRGPGGADGAPARIAGAGSILQLIRSGSAVTISRIAATLGVSRSTVTERVDLLMSSGLVESDGETQMGRGRPSARFAFRPDTGLTVGIQLGMSGSRVAVTDLAGEVLTSRTVDVDVATGPHVVLDAVCEAVDDELALVGREREELWGAAVGVPGRVELATADVTPDSPSWAGFDVAAHVGAALGVPVRMGRDVSMLALAEHRYNWPDARVLLCVKVGTAIGCGIVVDHRTIDGGAGLAGEIGHTAVSGSTAQCPCGNRGCLNATSAGAALLPRLAEMGVTASSTREIMRLALQGDPTTAQLVRQAGREVGEVLAGAINLLNPDVVVVWGYLADARDNLLAGIREAVATRAVPPATESLTIARASLGEDAGTLGAATLAIEMLLEPAAIDARLARRAG